MKRVLFVCSGNICRSPMAEFVFREMARRRRLTDAVDCESAGTNVFAPNSPVHNGTVRQLRRVLEQEQMLSQKGNGSCEILSSAGPESVALMRKILEA